LRKLIDGTTAATLVDGAIEPQAVLSAIRGSLVDLDLLAEEHRLSKPDTYTRHLLHADPNGLFSILALVWGPGQGSPVHGHHTWCAVGVYAGELIETFYRAEPGLPEPVLVRELHRRPGDHCFDAGGPGIHRIRNEGPDVAISIHVYGVGADRISTGVNRIYPLAA
jgi:predicted metal-dependent enzyme (double-stranded beta helix superfamily)